MLATEEIRKFLEEDYAQAFSSRQPRLVLEQFASNTGLLFHQLGEDKSGKGGKGKTVRVHTGSPLKALAKGRMPASMMLAIVFRRLAKSDYDRSVIQLIEVQGSFEGIVHAMVRWDRRDSEGEVFEQGYSVLKLDGAEGRWKIKEGWTLDDPDQWDANRTGVSFGPSSSS